MFEFVLIALPVAGVVVLWFGVIWLLLQVGLLLRKKRKFLELVMLMKRQTIAWRKSREGSR